MLESHATEVMDRADEVLKAVALAIADFLAAHMKVTISTVYPPASNPGEPPALRTGNLQDSIRVEEIDGQVCVVVGDDDAYYAIFLEFGTSTMDPRPFVEQTIRERLPEMLALAASVAQQKWSA
jgi:HK97 gp10 family phage protein